MKKILYALIMSVPVAAGLFAGIFSFCGPFQEIPAHASSRSQSSRPVHDVTSHIEYLGNPYQKIYPEGDAVYARNVWDLQYFEDKIFIGAGNSSNKGPAPNAGPLVITHYDLSSGLFMTEGSAAEEQIDVFRVLDHRLYIPGHDPTQSWKFGNFYRRNRNGTWDKYRNISEGLHNYDMAWFKGSLYAALGTADGGEIIRSVDEGMTWNVIYKGKHRMYSFLQVNDTLFSVSNFATGRANGRDSSKYKIRAIAEKIFSFLQVNDSFFDADKYETGGSGRRNTEMYGIAEVTENAEAMPRFDLSTAEIFPNTSLRPKKNAKIIRASVARDMAFYIGAYIHNDHQHLPFGLYAATSLRPEGIQTYRIPLPDDSLPWDLLVAKDTLYVLLSEETGGREALIRVLKAPLADPTSIEELFRFNYASFARSFEIVDGDFYFGIGCEVNDPKKFKTSEISPKTGELLKIRKDSLEKRAFP
jgi:hypothetical protein